MPTDITNELAFELFARWEDERARGNCIPLEEFCAAHPEALPDVLEIGRRLAGIAELFPSGSDEAAPPPGASPGTPPQHPPDWVEIGRGASSIVYRGYDPTFGTTVAYKVLHT